MTRELAGLDANYRRIPCLNADGRPKKAYDSPKTARRFARRTNRDGNGGPGGPMHEYHCPDCGRWHVGSGAGWANDYEPSDLVGR